MATRPPPTATLDGSHIVSQNAKGVFLVDAAGAIPDLKAVQPNAVLVGTPAFSSSGVMGGRLIGNGGAYAGSTPLAVAVGAFPIAMGGVFRYTGTKTQGSGFETLIATRNHAGNGVLCRISIHDGDASFGGAGNLGKIVALMTNQAGGATGYIVGPSYVSGTIHSVATLWTAYNTAMLVVDGTAYTTLAANASNAAWSHTLTDFSLLASYNTNGGFGFSTSAAEVALGWFATTGLTQANLESWTADPWAMFTQTTTTRTISVTLRDPVTLLPLANLTGLEWKYYQGQSTLYGTRNVNATDSGQNATTNASGVCTVTLTNSTNLNGDVGYFEIGNSDGTPTQNPAARGFHGPVLVTVV